ncbi:uncharacterized protein BT62DRAFT_919212 [Guyanagaster necrorhizus]|uniref:Uncharacterized protein n=1 Tax=Guyanagaster necrorhizus TaxID=856835 RepID=A0A9P7VWT1_9AGAR|nr:uncharacterized protein BT62DRAFT_919212 [Guyanagaster necrorhizus MCA 3950]KAG7447296.1 hypothetical protein BT62DRAFT_919212 [Guyanagaster necrorhizus MCA 3950]
MSKYKISNQLRCERKKMDGSMETIEQKCMNFLCHMDHNITDAAGKPVLDISDRELNMIFSEIHHSKGDRITVILDCSYMKGALSISLYDGTRKFQSLSSSTMPARKIPQASDESLSMRFPDHPSFLVQNWQPDMASQVILSACSDFQLAWEASRTDGTIGGVFALHLLEAFRAAKATMCEDLGRTLGMHCSPTNTGSRG